MAETLRAVLFDLDGTLIDTAPDLTDALNTTLLRLGLGPVAEATVRNWIGDGARALLGKALRAQGRPDAEAERAWAGFEADCAEHAGRRGRVHEGVREMLNVLRQRGVGLAVLTNKEGKLTHRLLALHDLSGAFDVVVAGDTLLVRKPDPACARHALEALDAEPDEALLIGDSVVDVRCARAAGVPVVLLAHGYPAGAIAGADMPDDLLPNFAALLDSPWLRPSSRVSIV